MIGGLFQISQKRMLHNGANETFTVRTDPHEITHPSWLSDTYKLGFGLSQGDKSAGVAAFNATNATDTGLLMTTEGSVTQDLWARLTHFGYMREETSKEPVDTMKTWAPVFGQQNRWVQFLLACKVDVLDDTTLMAVSKKMSKARPQFAEVPLKIMDMLRNGTNRVDEPFADASINVSVFKTMQRLGLTSIQGASWVPTVLGSLILPFFFDHLAHEKRAWLEEANQ